MLTCVQVTEILTEYLEGRMPLRQRLQFWMHIGMCRHCRAYIRQMRITIETAGKLPGPAVPPEIMEELQKRLKDMRHDSSI